MARGGDSIVTELIGLWWKPLDFLALLRSIETTPSPLGKWYYVQFAQEDWELLFVAP
jgi:hypothetical protein